MTQKLPDDPQQFVAELKALLTRWDAELEPDDNCGSSVIACFNLQCDSDGNVIRKQRELDIGRVVRGDK